MNDSTLCPCGSKAEYAACCAPLHEGKTKADTAEQLMRARYSAFVKQQIDFIIETAHSETHKETKREEIEQWAKESDWHAFEIIDTEKGGKDDEEGMVEFIAIYDDAEGEEVQHHERSVFAREDGDWKFVDGVSARQDPYVRETPKVGRNEPCPCGSGKKFKKCCGAA